MSAKKTFLSHNKEYHDNMVEMAKETTRKLYTDTLRDVFILGMVLAAKKGLEPVDIPEGKRKNSIRIPEVIGESHKFLFKILAYSHTQDHGVLVDEARLFEIAEQYANAGLEELLEEFDSTDYPLFELAELALE